MNLHLSPWLRSVLCCFVIIIVTFATFLPSLNNGFTNWDDDLYVTANQDIRDTGVDNLKKIFSSTYVAHYLPITMLSYMTEYHFFQLKPLPYHATNLLLHICNALLVFALLYALSGKYFVGVVVGLLFAIHPLRVESVAWIAERKDVLSAFFYLGSLNLFVLFRKSGRWRYYALCFAALLFSLLSKTMSVSQPFVLLLIDYVMHKKYDKKLLLDKIPFLILACLFVVTSYFGAKDAMNYFPQYSALQRVLTPAYEIMFYLVKSLAPFNLCAFYYLPEHPNFAITLQMMLSAIAVLGIGWAVFVTRRFSRKAIFGTLFFIITLLPVLQIIVSSGAWVLVADRYTYIPMIGIYFIFAEGCYYVLKVTFKTNAIARKTLIGSLIALGLLFCVLTFQQCGIWKDNFSLWNNCIAKCPSEIAFNNRGIAYNALGDYSHAIEDFNQAIQLNQKYAKPFNNRGDALNHQGDYIHAIDNYNSALERDPRYYEAYYNRGIAYYMLQNNDQALEDFNHAIALNPHYSQAFNNRSIIFSLRNDYDRALEDLNSAIIIDSHYAMAWYNRGNTYSAKGDRDRARDNFTVACKLGYAAACRELTGN